MSMFLPNSLSSSPSESSLLVSIKEAVRAAEQLTTPQAIAFLQQATTLISSVFLAGKKLLIAGNGGSLCDAMHFAEELTGFFRSRRRALPAIALSDPSHITCVTNDLSFDAIFSRLIESLGQPGDLFIGLTTSGNSSNLVRAFETAKEKGLYTIAFLGKGGGKLKGIADLEWIIDSSFETSDRIQEAHMAAIHILIEQVEYVLFPELHLSNTEKKPQLACQVG